MNIDDMNESRFLRAADCGEQGVLLVIEYVHKQNVAPLGEKLKEKWCSFHSNGVKPLVLNWTNRQKISGRLSFSITCSVTTLRLS